MDIEALFKQAEENTEGLQSQQETTYKRDERLLEMNKSKTVYFRMLPDLTGEKPTFYLPYRIYQWKSVITDKNIYGGVGSALFDKEKPEYLKTKQNELYEQGQNEKAKLLYPNEKRLVNIFVIDDSSNADNKGQFMVMNYSAKPVDPKRPQSGSPFMKALHKVMNDPDRDITLSKLFSLGKDGVTIKMTITAGERWPDFEFEFYDKKVKGFDGFPKSKLEEVYTKKAHNLYDFVDEPKSDEELEKLFRMHILGVSTQNSQPTSSPTNTFTDDGEDDDIPMGFDTDEATPTTSNSVAVEEEEDEDDIDIDAMLKEFE